MTTPSPSWPALRMLPATVRVGLTCLILTALVGFGASGRHLVEHHADRDERAGLSLDDIRGAYHGVRTTAPLVTALDRGHPDDVTTDTELLLKPAERATLEGWLASDRISEDYDNLDLGEMAPAEIIAVRCLPCHARQATLGDGVGERVPLDYWDDVKKAAFSREINPVDVKILTTSTHTHALGLASLSLVVVALVTATRWPRRLVGFVVAVIGIALLADIAAWWAARMWVDLVWVIVAAGAAYNASMVLALAGVLVDLWWPVRKKAA